MSLSKDILALKAESHRCHSDGKIFPTKRHLKMTYYQWLIQTKGFGGSQIGGRQNGLHLGKRLSATIVGCRTKVVTFCRPKMAIFVGRTMRFFKKKTQFESALIQKTFGTGPKQWVSFFTSYTDLAYLQNVLERYKCMLRASVCHCFGHP